MKPQKKTYTHNHKRYQVKQSGLETILTGPHGEQVTAQEIKWEGASVVKSDNHGNTYDAPMLT